MDINGIIESVQNKQFLPVYFLQGEEPYFIDINTKALLNDVLQEHEKDFNLHQFYAKDTKLEEVLQLCKQFPMMSERQLIVVKEAQEWRNLDKLETYLNAPIPSTVLVIQYKYKTLDNRKKLAKQLKKQQFLFTSQAVKEWHLPNWIQTYCQQQKRTISTPDSVYLSQLIGNNLNNIVSTIDKLNIILEKTNQTTITKDLIKENIALSKQFNIFDLNNAIGKKDHYTANLIINQFQQNPKQAPIVVIVGTLGTFFTKLLLIHINQKKSDRELASIVGLHPFLISQYKTNASHYPPNKIAKIFEYLRQTDLKSKGIGNSQINESELLKELVFKILN